jgi:hypothetical protein
MIQSEMNIIYNLNEFRVRNNNLLAIIQRNSKLITSY